MLGWLGRSRGATVLFFERSSVEGVGMSPMGVSIQIWLGLKYIVFELYGNSPLLVN